MGSYGESEAKVTLRGCCGCESNDFIKLGRLASNELNVSRIAGFTVVLVWAGLGNSTVCRAGDLNAVWRSRFRDF